VSSPRWLPLYIAKGTAAPPSDALPLDLPAHLRLDRGATGKLEFPDLYQSCDTLCEPRAARRESGRDFESCNSFKRMSLQARYWRC
jgi:hypothetical protein